MLTGWMRNARLTGRRLWRCVKRNVKDVLRQNTDPQYIALGAGIGVFAGALPLPGLQCILAVILAWTLRASRLAALTFVWTANPLFFYADYVIGKAIFEHFNWFGVGEVAEAGLASQAGTGLLMSTTGGVIFGLAVGAAGYLCVLLAATTYRNRLALKRR